MSTNQYCSSEQVLDGIAAAYSTSNNPRGLECFWTSPYIQTLTDLTSSMSNAKGNFLVYAPYTFWMPALVRKQMELQQEFERYGLNYDNIPRNQTRLYKAKAFKHAEAHLKQQLPTLNPPTKAVGANALRKSQRIEEKRVAETKHQIPAKILKMELEKLFKRREALEVKQELYSERLKNANDPAVDAYDISIDSIKDVGSFGRQPDIYVSHIATALLSEPDPQNKDHVERHKLRCGRKVYHQCGAVIVELKQGPTRQKLGINYTVYAMSVVVNARDDQLEYCSAYFASHPESMSVIAIATAGPVWTWANINRSSTPKWDFLENCPNTTSRKNKRLEKEWPSLFSVVKHLGTEDSDKELSKIRDLHISKLIGPDHTYKVPPWVQDIEENEDEEEDDAETGEGVESNWGDKGDVESSEEDEEDRGTWTDDE